ncbi:tryptophan-rich sensory protein [Microbacterium sp. EYE_5]|uniref:tryptophan-rich sensory protein n=1 Tax=unclassified Microbacterium TaxID=2609290 RepID=UPI002004547A|nr:MULTISPECIES: tryptophan-rich sensory protein [unclassified Microbacterium]MCK6079910.1 tryptophan-rich sensory protein [Microbacterium sp. EYE_382]MCK6085181.1 tryptophan-rich sensory protein [Microbacterium sp. EYE_384]MCK6122593.1 tryptophan-rich sensory protein [Microbacterium sp. EYE_80]MCK6125944.1 tryptophan-rich sensory protein [Microbacterium sp. EYE_79]MCK6140865.1 tryptophan-rich sensory protein [Microbacterium sp. EYE_39]
MSTSTATASSDIARQVVVISAVTFMIIAALFGAGVLGGTAVQDLQGGALSATATILAPASSAFSIWSVIYLFMIAYTIWQALPSQRGSARQRIVGYPIALTAVLNGLWLLAAQYTTLLLTVITIVALLAALGYTISLLVRNPPRTFAETFFTDVTVGLHLGWVTLATVANTTAWLKAEVVPESWGQAADAWGIAVLAVVVLIAAASAIGTRARLAPALASAWGLAWIGVGRFGGEPESTPVAIAAWIAAAIVVLVPLVLWITGRRRGELAFARD